MDPVSFDTIYLRQAIAEAEPQKLIKEACNNNLQDNIFIHKEGGITGGTLFNISTAALTCLRVNSEEPLTKHPLELQEKVRSFIGQLLVRIMNDSLCKDYADDPEVFCYDGEIAAQEHFCREAEEYFINSMKLPAGGILIADTRGRSIFYQKRIGVPSSLLVNYSGARIRGIWHPPGTICNVRSDWKCVPIGQRKNGFLSTLAIHELAVMRISSFAIPINEREKTLTPPNNTSNHGPFTWLPLSHPTIDLISEQLQIEANAT